MIPRPPRSTLSSSSAASDVYKRQHTYDALPLPHVAWGQRVLMRMRLTGTERVLDAGCGTGRDAAVLLERLPGIDLVCLDASEQMIEAARERLGDRATLVVADLTQPLPIAPVD